MAKTKDATGAAPSGQLTTKADAKPDVDHELEGLMSEIESDLREEEFKKLWSRYGTVIMAAAIALVLGVLAFQLWHQYETRSRDAIALRYEQATKDMTAGKYDAALGEFKGIASEKFAGGYAVLAQLDEAAADLKKNDEAGAIAIYTAVAADKNVDQVFRDLATVLRALHSMDKADPKTLEAALAPIASPNNPFNYTALELSGLLAAKQGDTARAHQLFQQLVNDPGAPAGVRQRATDLVALYKAPEAPAAVTPVPAAPAATPPASAPSTPNATQPSAVPPASKP